MVTTGRAKDVPQSWFSQQKPTASTKQRRHSGKSKAVDDAEGSTVLSQHFRRGPSQPTTQTTLSDATKGKKRRRRTATSTTDIVLALSKNAVPDADELRKKREEDAQACGRTVRTVKKPGTSKNWPSNSTLESSARERYQQKEVVAALPGCRAISSFPKSSVLPISAEENNLDQEDAFDCIEPLLSGRPNEEHVTDDYHDAASPPMTVVHTLDIASVNPEIETNRDYDDIQQERQGRISRRRQSVINQDSSDHYQSNEEKHEKLRKDALRGGGVRYPSEPSFFPQLLSKNHRRNSERRNESPGSHSPRRSFERSDGDRSYDRRRRSQSGRREYYGDYAFSTGSDVERWNSGSYSRVEHRHRRHRRSYDSSFPEINRRSRRSPSLGQRLGQRKQWKRSTSLDQSRSPPRMLQTGSKPRPREWAISTATDAEINASTSQAIERKERRHNQKLRESQQSQREKEGKKPFYLTLNDEGKPYGPGKPAWIAEINKLAVGLDPSCTHVRKQTFEDVQTFKDRLNEKFDYSGILNEDFLRGLMGRAVTKRRGELISLIRRDGPPPNYINDDVWKRLEKLAHSEQRQQKSEQGRYANACRITRGRTGSIGINGVREKLRSRFGRSPDPDEILEEMHRDKGYGGAKRKVPPTYAKKEKSLRDMVLSDEEMRSDALEEFSDRSSSDTSASHHCMGRQRNPPQSIGRGRDYDVHDVDNVTARVDVGQHCYNVTETKKMSTNEYIEKLKGEIERLQAENAKASSSNIGMQSQPTMSAAYDNMD